jgi:hypothetical protein
MMLASTMPRAISQRPGHTSVLLALAHFVLVIYEQEGATSSRLAKSKRREEAIE